MKLGLFHKLFIAILGLMIIVLSVALFLLRWSFESGFDNYIQEQEQSRLENLGNDLSQYYDENQSSWSKLTRQAWHDALVTWSQDSPRHASGRQEHRPPPHPYSAEREPAEPERGANRHDIRPPRPPGAPTALFDTRGKLVKGSARVIEKNNKISIDIKKNNEVIGKLVTLVPPEPVSPLDSKFSKQQQQASILIGGFALLIAIVFSWLLAKMIARPLQKTIVHVNELANGNYDSRLNDTREDELGDLMRNIDALAIKLEKNKKARNQWIADISHELRTPLTILLGEVEAVIDGVRSMSPEQLLSFQQELKRLDHLANDLYELSLSDIGGLSYDFSPVDLQECLHDMVSDYQQRARESGLQLSLEQSESVTIKADVKRLQQLLRNLLENALAYTHAPGSIDVYLTLNNRDAHLVIEDSAPGASEKECQQLFEPLYRQESSRSRRTAGAGLGLAICKNIVEAHHGTITAELSRKGGLSISIHFPVSKIKTDE